MSEALTTRRSDARQEPRFDQPRPPGPAGNDPLAELARLVGQDDPFRAVFRGGTEGSAAQDRQTVDDAGHAPPAHDPHHPDPAMFGHDDRPVRDDDEAHRFRPSPYGYDGDHAEHSPASHQGYAEHEEFAADDDGRYEAHGVENYGAGDPRAVLTPDVWAQGEDDHAAVAHSGDDPGPEAIPSARTPRRPLVVLAAVLLLTGGGLAATFFARAGTSVGVGKEAPTIMAANGPNKIKLADPSATAPVDADAALLNKGGVPGGTARVVNSQEQPIDLAQLPKTAARTDTDAGGGGFFPQPRKVKTFVVRPDGTIVGAATSPGPGAAPAVPPPARAADANALPIGLTPGDLLPTTAAVPRAGTPKTPARAPTTPKVTADTTISDLTQGPGAGGTGRARQPASPGVHAAPKVRPIEVAEADAGVTPGAGGNFGLQLTAAPSEQDARDAFSKLQKKFSSQLGSFKPTIRKADTGDKTVYRVRVGNLGQDEAKTLCSQLQAGGGSCYVVHN